MKNALYGAGALALLAIATLFLTLSWVAGQVPHKIDAIQADLNNHALFLRAEASRQIEQARKDILVRAERQISGFRADALARVDQSLSIADGRLGDSLALVDRRTGDGLTRVDRALGQLDHFRAALQPTLENAASITGHADEAAAILFRRDALPAQLLGLTAAGKVTLGETAQTMKTVRDAAPKFVAQGQAVVGNVNSVAENINRLTKPHWYDRLLGYGLNGLLMYRQLNPVTNLTVQAAQAASSQK